MAVKKAAPAKKPAAKKAAPEPVEVHSEIEAEFHEALGDAAIMQEEDQDRQEYLEALGDVINSDALTEEAYESLSKKAKAWWSKASTAMTDGEPIPEFPDYEAPAEEGEEGKQASETEGEEATGGEEEPETETEEENMATASKGKAATKKPAAAAKKPSKPAAKPAAKETKPKTAAKKSNGAERISADSLDGMKIKAGSGAPRDGSLRAAQLKAILACKTASDAIGKTYKHGGESHAITAGVLNWHHQHDYIDLS